MKIKLCIFTIQLICEISVNKRVGMLSQIFTYFDVTCTKILSSNDKALTHACDSLDNFNHFDCSRIHIYAKEQEYRN